MANAVVVKKIFNEVAVVRKWQSRAVSVSRWLNTLRRVDDVGTWWPLSDTSVAARPDLSLYRGIPGILVFLLELHAASGEACHLQEASRCAALLVARAKQISRSRLTWASMDGLIGCGLYSGTAGIAFALAALARVTGEREHLSAARMAFAGVVDDATAGRPQSWNGANDVYYGAAGIGFALLLAAEIFQSEEFRAAAIEAGNHLLSHAQAEGSGCWWPSLFGRPKGPPRYPNYSHGTAGVAHYLARLYQSTGDSRFLDGAVRGANWLRAIRKPLKRGAVWHHHDPGGERLYYAGWCHGPAGTARLYYLLNDITGDPQWRALLADSSYWLRSRRLFERPMPGLWNAGMCCGVAGIADFFAGLACRSSARHDREWAIRCGDQLMTLADGDANAPKWIQAEHRIRPELRLAQTGYGQGAAGIGLCFLRIAMMMGETEKLTCRLPDDPFPLHDEGRELT